jgi:hypothetical protein
MVTPFWINWIFTTLYTTAYSEKAVIITKGTTSRISPKLAVIFEKPSSSIILLHLTYSTRNMLYPLAVGSLMLTTTNSLT